MKKLLRAKSGACDGCLDTDICFQPEMTATKSAVWGGTLLGCKPIYPKIWSSTNAVL
jgi:hypothetical protein